MNNHEYSGPSVKGSGCSYATLNSYNQNYFGRNGGAVGSAVASQTKSLETVVVPSYGGVGYNSLAYTQQEPQCGGYYNVRNAYPNFANGCGRFSSRQCGL